MSQNNDPDKPPSLEPPKLPKFLRFRKRRISGREANLLALASSVGLSLVIAIALGAAGGWWLDQRLGTKPWLSLVGLLLGLVAGFRNIFIISDRVDRESRDLARHKKDQPPKDEDEPRE